MALDVEHLVSVDDKVRAIWVWAYIEGISSWRQIEHSMAHEPALMWLSGLRAISHASLSNFRKDHRKELEGLFTQLLGRTRTNRQ
ncbi:MAG TPA: transposase [Bryobacteraceae bacterium]|nr:transposase [Bryobacteraceae bacterium]